MNINKLCWVSSLRLIYMLLICTMSLCKKQNLLYFTFLNYKATASFTGKRNCQDQINTVYALKQQKFFTGRIKVLILKSTVFMLRNNSLFVFIFYGTMNFKMYEFEYKAIVSYIVNLCIWEANLLTELTCFIYIYIYICIFF